MDPDVVTFVGFHWPMVMARVARRLHAPAMTIVYENGIVEDRITPVFPTSPCDLVAADGATMCAGSVDALYMWLGAGRVGMTMLEAAIVDRHGNINTTAVGPYKKPLVRLPGSGGGTELGSMGRGLLLVSASTNSRSYPDCVDYITSPGYLGGRSQRSSLGYKPGTGPQRLVNPLGLFGFNEAGELFPTAVHPGVTVDDVRACFGWPIAVPDTLNVLPEPNADELAIVREELEHARERAYLLPQD
ncbi:CoA-transferase [Sphingobium subterraneum]|uniref:Glutaconate CoA-transferase subunit B n=1 Tax=Sphingobium subterraneum TaxID=627688 RepID=A0A841J2X4_9SPHN|nr:CoA-transferase [Sphingobium subterraneum]MBB6122965.1 glutaconate CoA-transferase subunit B [Sphingobium subterraneum]